MKFSGIYIFIWWSFFAFCGADVVHMCYHTMTSVLTVGKLAQSFASVATRNNVTKKQLDQEPRRINFTYGRNLSTQLTNHKRATRNGDVNNHIAEHHLQTKHQIDWAYSTDQTQPTFEILLCGLKITDSKRVYSIGRVFYSSPCKSPLSFSGGLIRNVIGFPLHKVIAVIKNESSITSFYDTINACSDFFSSLSLYGKPLWVPLVQR